MELVGILRILVRHRMLVAIGLAATVVVAAGAFAGLSGPPGTVHTAQSRVLIDARVRPAIGLDSSVADTLGLRAGLLADLMTTVAVQRRIAAAVGLPLTRLAVLGPSMDPAPLPLPRAVSAAEVATVVDEPYVVRVSAKGSIPFLEITASAPSVAEASALVRASQANLEELVVSRPTRGTALEVEPLGPIVTRSRESRPPRMLAAAAGMGFLGTWCAGIIIVSGLARSWRRRRRD